MCLNSINLVACLGSLRESLEPAVNSEVLSSIFTRSNIGVTDRGRKPVLKVLFEEKRHSLAQAGKLQFLKKKTKKTALSQQKKEKIHYLK